MFKKEEALYECTKIDKIIHQKSLKNVRIIYKYRCIYYVYTHRMERVIMEWKEINNEKEVEMMTMATTVQKWGNSLAVLSVKISLNELRFIKGLKWK